MHSEEKMSVARTTASAIRRKHHITATVNGMEFVLRRVPVIVLLQSGLLPPAVQAVVAPDLPSGDPPDPEAVATRAEGLSIEDRLNFTRVMCKFGMVAPRLWEGPDDECPEDAVTWADICDEYAGAICGICSGKEAAETAEAVRFPDSGGSGGPAASDGVAGGDGPGGVSAPN